MENCGQSLKDGSEGSADRILYGAALVLGLKMRAKSGSYG
jgi:hypothetical protein